MLVEAPAGGRDHRLPREGQLLGGEGVSFSCLISRVVVGLPRGFVFAFGAEGPLSAHLSSLPTFLSSVLDFLPDKAFFLYDTLGFPIDLTELMAQEAGMTVDMEGCAAEMEGQKRRSCEARLAARGLLRWRG